MFSMVSYFSMFFIGAIFYGIQSILGILSPVVSGNDFNVKYNTPHEYS